MFLHENNVVTSFSNAGYIEYGKKFVDTFLKYWPTDVKLFIYHEGLHPPENDRIQSINLLREVGPCVDFLRRHDNNEVAKGRQITNSQRWKQKCIDEGYNFRFDAFKFCRKPFAVQDLLLRINREYSLDCVQNAVRLFWVDADVVTFQKIPKSKIPFFLPKGIPVSYLGRDTCYSECGFVGYDITTTDARALIHGVANLYANDGVFNISEWHDSFIFDHVKNSLRIKGFNISDGGRGHVFNNSMLGLYMDHLKGDRKQKGKSEMPHNTIVKKCWEEKR